MTGGPAVVARGLAPLSVLLCGVLAAVAVAPYARAGDPEWKRLHHAATAKYRAFEYAGAVEDLKAALAAATVARDDKATPLVLGALGDALVALGRDAEAEGAYRRLLEWDGKHLRPGDAAANAPRWALYAVDTARGRREEAGRVLKTIVDEPVRPVTATLLLVDGSDINKVTLLSGFPVKYSEPLARRALRVYEQAFGAERAAAPMNRLAAVLQELGRIDEAQRLEQKVRSLGGEPPGAR